MGSERVAVIGAGMGGLAAALTLAARGVAVTVLEKGEAPGGKMRAVPAGDTVVDGGPTVFTMRWILDELLAEAGFATDEHLRLTPLRVLARHAWDGSDGLFDLAGCEHATAEAIARFAGPAEARGFRAFAARASAIHETLDRTFMRATRPNPLGLVGRAGVAGLTRLWGVSPFAVLWDELGKHFRDARLRQLFARYATYCGANPFTAPATLMLIAHVEQRGVWAVEGGMHSLARTLAALAERAGATFRFGAEVAEILVEGGRVAGVKLADGERIAAERVVVNADVAALSAGLFGEAARRAVPDQGRVPRSLSALTWTGLARVSGLPAHPAHGVLLARLSGRVRPHRGRPTCRASPLYMSAPRIGETTPPLPPARNGCSSWSTPPPEAIAGNLRERRSSDANGRPSRFWRAAG
ncbi:MAG: FAD-dependent oxidoreductase [Acetobacteraceae bacterium]|nr:FAD-dependent oxidoreductase [Acetobacteraceae bacterium]